MSDLMVFMTRRNRQLLQIIPHHEKRKGKRQPGDGGEMFEFRCVDLPRTVVYSIVFRLTELC